jgi:hypothetical protein
MRICGHTLISLMLLLQLLFLPLRESLHASSDILGALVVQLQRLQQPSVVSVMHYMASSSILIIFSRCNISIRVSVNTNTLTPLLFAQLSTMQHPFSPRLFALPCDCSSLLFIINSPRVADNAGLHAVAVGSVLLDRPCAS